MLPNEKISCVLQIWFLYTEFINFLLKFAVNVFQCCSSLVKYYSSESMLLLTLSYVSSNMHVSLSFLKNSSFWKIRETQNKHLIIWKKLFEIYKFVFVMLNLLNSSLNSVRNLYILGQIEWRTLWCKCLDGMLISVVKMKVKIGEKKVSLDFCKLLPKEFWEERKKFFFWNCGPGHFQAEFASSGCILSTTLCFFALTVMKLISSRHWCNEASLYCRLKARCPVEFNRHLSEPDIDLL